MKASISFLFLVLIAYLINHTLDPVSSETVPQNVVLNLSRFIVAFLLHFQVLPEIRGGIQIMQYCKNNSDVFSGNLRAWAYVIGMFQLSGAFFCEYVNIITIMQSASLADVIKDYIAFGIIAEIDNIVATIMFTSDIAGEIEEANIQKDLRHDK